MDDKAVNRRGWVEVESQESRASMDFNSSLPDEMLTEPDQTQQPASLKPRITTSIPVAAASHPPPPPPPPQHQQHQQQQRASPTFLPPRVKLVPAAARLSSGAGSPAGDRFLQYLPPLLLRARGSARVRQPSDFWIVKTIGPERAKKYFQHLERFLSSKLSKNEFDKLCLVALGRENLPLHNHLIRSILFNASAASGPPEINASKMAEDVTNSEHTMVPQKARGCIIDPSVVCIQAPVKRHKCLTELWCAAPNELMNHDSPPGTHADA
ncbi:hypothetical protein ZWY2020_025137 [Hordeum vulgare]|nr:hypothetical protein ZWY2020_025137 [Hordeum vulgare]